MEKMKGEIRDKGHFTIPREFQSYPAVHIHAHVPTLNTAFSLALQISSTALSILFSFFKACFEAISHQRICDYLVQSHTTTLKKCLPKEILPLGNQIP